MSTRGEKTWTVTAGTAVAAGVMAGGGTLGWTVTCSLIAIAASFAWFVAYTGCLGEGPFASQLVQWFGAGLASVAVIGLLELLGTLSLLIVAMVALAHPTVTALLRPPDRRSPPEPRVVGSAVPVPEDAGLVVSDTLTLEDLCLAWCSSYVALQRAQTTSARLCAVAIRALYLDELERRMGPAFARWIASGPRAAQDPRGSLRRDA